MRLNYVIRYHSLINYFQCIWAIFWPAKWIASTDEVRDHQKWQHQGIQAELPILRCTSAFHRCLVCNTCSAFMEPCLLMVRVLGIWSRPSGLHKMLPGTIDGMKHVCFFRHALALDEQQVKFLPEYAYGGSATCAK